MSAAELAARVADKRSEEALRNIQAAERLSKEASEAEQRRDELEKRLKELDLKVCAHIPNSTLPFNFTICCFGCQPCTPLADQNPNLSTLKPMPSLQPTGSAFLILKQGNIAGMCSNRP